MSAVLISWFLVLARSAFIDWLLVDRHDYYNSLISNRDTNVAKLTLAIVESVFVHHFPTIIVYKIDKIHRAQSALFKG